MIDWNPKYILLLGFVLLIIGVVLPLLMVMHIIESTFFLNFFSYAASFMGLMFGFIGSILFVTRERYKRKWREENENQYSSRPESLVKRARKQRNKMLKGNQNDREQ